MYEEPLLYLGKLKLSSTFIEEESTSVFEVPSKPSLLERQLHFFERKNRYVALMLLSSEKVFGKIIRVEQEQVLLETEQGKIWIAINAIRSIH